MDVCVCYVCDEVGVLDGKWFRWLRAAREVGDVSGTDSLDVTGFVSPCVVVKLYCSRDVASVVNREL